MAIIESRRFLRESLWRGIDGAFNLHVQGFSSLRTLESHPHATSFVLVILSWLAAEDARDENLADLRKLRCALPGASVVVLAAQQDAETVTLAFANGASGYIPVSIGLEIAIEAVRFVLAGGTYAPPEVLLGSTNLDPPASAASAVTSREMVVIKKVQLGKPNKVIAYELGMCESTVKVHVRQIMKKLGAKNRTDLAIKAHDLSRR